MGTAKSAAKKPSDLDRVLYAIEEVRNELRKLTASLPGQSAILQSIVQQGGRIMAEIDELEREVGENTSVVNSAITVMDDIKRRLDEAIASGNMDRVRAVREQLDSTEQRLAEAIARNTPAGP